MTVDLLLPVLALGTMGAVVVFAIISQRRAARRLHNPNAPKSSLARSRPDPAFTPDATETRKDVFPDENSPRGPIK
jgi:hypothetical protein